ncbi:DUF2119 family protein [Methanococcus voltae]|uniref:DUF2119 domain-containing protein n=2 Tax=Methanococcus voltae TaxID=2188 RepID=A0A8J7S4V2_METVO|nr:DUF2119 family protein [Methanococcus voltae]MBP2172553.1 hypothetical protein [Methanococcus voltae]MBP2201540.1 hypothetical protein [Methanococcus voltae]MCS3922329.1 hypothetical protein [Methanococcus voltae PS]
MTDLQKQNLQKPQINHKLIVGGLHGDEGQDLKPIFDKFDNYLSIKYNLNDKFINSENSEITVIPHLNKNYDEKYISTISKGFLNTNAGKNLTKLLNENSPNFYIEVHTYEKASYKNLTNEQRYNKTGVPPLVDISNNILVASVSPLYRNLLSKNTFCMTLEVPKWKLKDDGINNQTEKEDLIDEIISIFKMVLVSNSKDELINKLFYEYPNMQKAKNLAIKYNMVFL